MKHLIKKYNLAPHPEGGYFKEIYRSVHTLASPITSETRNWVTHIYFLLVQGQISRFHRVIHDEIWNFYEGDPIQLVQFNGVKITETTMGQGCNDYAAIVPGNTWQAAVITGRYSLVGCTVAPGFDFSDFSFLKDTPAELERFRTEKTGYDHLL